MPNKSAALSGVDEKCDTARAPRKSVATNKVSLL